ncbi:MAG TPA: hypothetical protein VFR84_07485 [Candidatus Angelobacter sp.]|nr:hypothetical protein [Candidatus Angelobacter sp.]
MKRTAILIFFLACSLAADAQTVKGVVRNGTTNKPSAGDKVTLMQIGQGMDEVAHTRTNAKGEFTFNAPPTQQPYIVWIDHQGVTYTQRAMPGGTPVVARVFDAASEVQGINILEHAILYHTGEAPNTLSGEEIFTLGNTSNPPRTLLKKQTLEFYLPEGAKVSESSVRTGAGTDLKTDVTAEGNNKYGFSFPIRPGETQFHVLYNLPYSGSLKIDPKSDVPVQTLVVAAPESMKFAFADSSSFQRRDNPQFRGVAFYVAKSVTPQKQVSYELAGTGAMPQASEAPAGASAGGAESGRPGGGLGLPNQAPDPLQSGQWLFLGVLSLFLAAGAVFVYTSNRYAVVAVPGNLQDRSGMLMEVLKEEVFQLEADRLQGKVSQQEYQTTKAALDKTLQRAVQRQSPARAK